MEGFTKAMKEAGVYGKINVVFDPVGGKYAETAFKALGAGGRFVVFGFASGGMNPQDAFPKFPTNLMLMKEQTIMGAIYAGHLTGKTAKDANSAMNTMLGWAVDGKLKPMVSKTYPMSDYSQAFKDLIARKTIGKVVIKCNNIAAASAKL
eukprot:gnl/TRDRNA2_/TRDRNA2_109445_c1_seq1.p1 gnl/TRDRNA2_/TRDRNA2_109445_c1~~gnl/TRDRNA2_/TRDRNA2_109445_c1_seq1.p1  ORF type:complete len:166 (-),score=45.88 gnl/TRDRNA2_/TRDRNA2_109445_c1_seq1:65-514(-)